MNMVFIARAPRCSVKNVDKPQSFLFQNGNSTYVQPAKRGPIRYIRPYEKPTLKIDSDTTYGLSYMKFDCIPKRRINCGIHEKEVVKNPGKLDFDTVYKLSYHISKGKIPKPFIPKSCLSINGSIDMTTIHMTSYKKPGYVKTKCYEPYRGKVAHPVSMDSETIMKESYQDFGMPIEVKRPIKPKVWHTKFKTDYQTTSRLSYQCMGPISKKTQRAPYQPIISSQIEKDTVYTTSYRIPGRLIEKEDVISK